MLVNSSQEEGGEVGVWLRVRILKSLVLSLTTTVRAMRDSLRDAAQVCAASLRIIGSISVNSTERARPPCGFAPSRTGRISFRSEALQRSPGSRAC